MGHRVRRLGQVVCVWDALLSVYRGLQCGCCSLGKGAGLENGGYGEARGSLSAKSAGSVQMGASSQTAATLCAMAAAWRSRKTRQTTAAKKQSTWRESAASRTFVPCPSRAEQKQSVNPLNPTTFQSLDPGITRHHQASPAFLFSLQARHV